MSDTKAMVSIEYVLADIRSRIEFDNRSNQRIAQMIISCYSELNMFHIPIAGIKHVELSLSSINTIDVPEDYIDYVRIGRVVNGKVVTFSLNPDLSKTIDKSCGEDTNPNMNIENNLPNYYNFGTGGGYNSMYYTYDKRERRLIFQGDTLTGKIYLEYISTGINDTGKTFIDRRAVPALRAYVIWQIKENDDKAPLWDRQRKAAIYDQEVRRLGNAIYNLTIDEMMDALYQGYRQTPKR